MAIAKGKTTTATTFNRYIGYAPVQVIAVNPTQKELEEIFGRESREVSYTGNIDIDGKSVATSTIDIVVKTTDSVKDDNGKPLNLIGHIRISLQDRPSVSGRTGKVQVLDLYNRTNWVTTEECKNHIIPDYVGAYGLDKDYRQMFVHEDYITNFIQKFLGIPNVQKWNNGTVVGYIDNPSEAESRLDVSDIRNTFKGDFSKIKEYINYQPDNVIVVFFGIRTGEDGRQYQVIYSRDFVRSSNTENERKKVYNNLQNSQQNGALPNTEFANVPLKVYEVTPTDFSSSTVPSEEEAPFADSSW
jgi:hypothetical protein